MTDPRNEILRATSAASALLARTTVGQRSSFDIIGAINDIDVPLLFRPLDGLWGACVTVAAEIRGVLITTKLPLAVQRFTLAHELGHIMLGHQISLDENDSIGFAGRFSSGPRPPAELAADIFASEILAPRALILAASKRLGWTKEALGKSDTIYQLSLRLGISFKATCWALATQNVISRLKAEILQRQVVKEIKQRLAPPEKITNPWADVWRLEAGDSGSFIEAGPEDILSIALVEKSSSGYSWDLIDVDSGVEKIAENISEDLLYGSSIKRNVLLKFNAPGFHILTFEHRRPWSGQSIEKIGISVDNFGKEQDGYPRRTKEFMLSDAVA